MDKTYKGLGNYSKDGGGGMSFYLPTASPVRVEYIAAGGEVGAANVSDKPLSVGGKDPEPNVVIPKGAREKLDRAG